MSHLLSQQKLRYPALRADDFRGLKPGSPRKAEIMEIASISQETYIKFQYPREIPRSAPSHRNVTMRLVARAADTTRLRELVASACGDNLLSVRISPILRTKNVHFWLSLKCDDSLVDILMADIMRHLPSAQFGRFDTF